MSETENGEQTDNEIEKVASRLFIGIAIFTIGYFAGGGFKQSPETAIDILKAGSAPVALLAIWLNSRFADKRQEREWRVNKQREREIKEVEESEKAEREQRFQAHTADMLSAETIVIMTKSIGSLNGLDEGDLIKDLVGLIPSQDRPIYRMAESRIDEMHRDVIEATLMHAGYLNSALAQLAVYMDEGEPRRLDIKKQLCMVASIAAKYYYGLRGNHDPDKYGVLSILKEVYGDKQKLPDHFVEQLERAQAIINARQKVSKT